VPGSSGGGFRNPQQENAVMIGLCESNEYDGSSVALSLESLEPSALAIVSVS